MDETIVVEESPPNTPKQPEGISLTWFSGTLVLIALAALATMFFLAYTLIWIPIVVMSVSIGSLIVWAVTGGKP